MDVAVERAMILDKPAALTAIYAAIDEINMSLEDDKKLPKSPDAPIFGQDGVADSLTLVNLVMAVENHLYDLIGAEVLLASENAMSRRKSPYRSASALAEYAVEVVNGAGAQ